MSSVLPVTPHANGATSTTPVPALGSAAPPAPPDVVELDAATIRSAMWRHFITLQWSWNYERMQALGYCFSMLPIINKVYQTKEERIAAMKRHLVFYNTNPQVGSPPIFGATVALEAQRQGAVVDSLKIGLMGPMAGIGDTVQAILFRPIVAVLAASLALAGSGVGPLIMVASGLFWTFLQIPLFRFGYRRGIGVAQDDRAPRANVVEQLVAVSVIEVLPAAAFDDQRLSADGTERSHGAVHPTDENFFCALEDFPRTLALGFELRLRFAHLVSFHWSGLTILIETSQD